MDKYEYRLKAEQIEKLVKKKDYQTAVKISDTIDWRRVKNLNMLYIVADLYEAVERYEDCMEILNIAYDRAPVGRMLLYKMTEIATRTHNFEEAIKLYREFVKADLMIRPIYLEVSDLSGAWIQSGRSDQDPEGI